MLPTVASAADLMLSEFLASNCNGLRDEDGTSSDWIEIHNAGVETVVLTGLSLTDKSSTPQKWVFPAGNLLAPDGYLVVFASGKDKVGSGGELHTNFAIGASGEYLGLYDGDLLVLSEYSPKVS